MFSYQSFKYIGSEKVTRIYRALDKFKQVIMEIFDQLDEKFTMISKGFAEIKQITRVAEEKEVETVELAKSNKIDFTFKHESLLGHITLLKNQMDEQINRNMQSTLIISGVKGYESNWSEVSDLLAKTINSMNPKSDVYSSSWIERAHRAKRKIKDGGKPKSTDLYNNWIARLLRKSEANFSVGGHLVSTQLLK